MTSYFSNLSSVGEIYWALKSPDPIWELEWRIPDFVSLMDRGDGLNFSPIFSFAGTIWRLYYRVSLNNIHIGLCRESTIPPISPKVSVGIKTLNGEKDRERATKVFIIDSGWEDYRCSYCLEKSELLKMKSDLLPSNVLTVLYTLESSKGIEDVGEPYESASSDVLQENKVLNDFKELFLRKEDCDVVINVQGQEFQAHKAILKARSPVLASTFRSDMKEKANGIMDIEDCDPSSFSDFLCFLYCGDRDVISEENVFNLFKTADKYDVQDLRAQCMKFMKEKLSVETFCDTMSLALRHYETELIKLTTDFFTKNAPEIILTVKWQSFLAENPTESNELFVKLLVPNSSNLSK